MSCSIRCWRVAHANHPLPMTGLCQANYPTAAMMAKIAGHVWSFNELFDTVLGSVRAGNNS